MQDGTNPSRLARQIARRFDLYGEKNVTDTPSTHTPIAKQLGMNHMSDLAPFLPAVPKDQAIATISSYCKVREGCDNIYALVFRLPKDRICPKGLTANQKADWFKEQAGLSNQQRGRFVVRTQELPATSSHPVALVFCEDLALQLVDGGLKLLQMQVSCDPTVLTQHGRV